MDPFVQYQNNVQSETIKTQVANLLQNLNLANAGNQHLNTFLERPADPIQDVITDFNFVIPQFTLDQIFALPDYTRPNHMIHYRKENGKNYYNTNQNSFAYQDPDGAAAIAQNRIFDRDNNVNREEMLNAGAAAKNRAIIANIAAAAIPPTWVLCKRTEPNDVRAEEPLIVFTDDVRKIVDWHQFALNLKELGESLGYTEAHYIQAIRRLVSFYEPALMPSLRGQTATNQAKFLLSLKPPTPLRQQQFKDIQALTRKANSELRIIMNILENLASGYYIDEPLDRRTALVNQLMIKGLQSFTTGLTHTALRQALQNNVNLNQPSEHKSLTKAAIAMEEIHGKPQEDLPYATSQMASVALFQTSIGANTAVFDPVLGQMNPCHPPVMMTPALHHQPNYGYIPADYTYPAHTPANFVDRQNRPQIARPAQQDQARALSPVRNTQADPQTTPVQAQRTATSQHPLTTDQRQTTEYTRYETPRQTGTQSQGGIPTGRGLTRTPNQPQSETTIKQEQEDEYDEELETQNSIPSPYAKELLEKMKNLEKQVFKLNNSIAETSGDRKSRTPERTNRKSGYNSYKRNNSQSYENSRSQERNGRTPPTYRKDSRENSRNRNSYSSSSRSNSYRNNSPYRNSRPRERSNSPYRKQEYSPASRNSGQYRNRSPSPGYRADRSRGNTYSNYRSISPSRQDSYRQEMNPGTNCHPKYDKEKGKSCSKCNARNEHHEYQCPTYRIWVPNKCRICNEGYHVEKACRKQNNSRSPTPNRNSKNY